MNSEHDYIIFEECECYFFDGHYFEVRYLGNQVRFLSTVKRPFIKVTLHDVLCNIAVNKLAGKVIFFGSFFYELHRNVINIEPDIKHG